MNRTQRYVVCLSNQGYEASLVIRRIYEVVPDSDADSHDMIRVLDESGEDYLFPSTLFEEVEIPAGIRQKFALGN